MHLIQNILLKVQADTSIKFVLSNEEIFGINVASKLKQVPETDRQHLMDCIEKFLEDNIEKCQQVQSSNLQSYVDHKTTNVSENEYVM